MRAKHRWLTLGLAAGLVGTYLWWRRTHRTPPLLLPARQTPFERLQRVAPLIRLPSSPDQAPDVSLDGSGLRCPKTGRLYPYRDGILDLLEPSSELSRAQQAFQWPILAWAYDESREQFVRWTGLPDLASEVALIQRSLALRPDDVVLDLACGHGVFALEWARRVGPEGLVIGLDLSKAMLERAVKAASRWDLENIVFIRGDAHHLPFGGGTFSALHCACGFHQFPDLPQVLSELARVGRPGAPLAASTLARTNEDPRAALKDRLEAPLSLRFLSLETLGTQLKAAGFEEYSWHFPRGWFGYTAARRARPVSS